MEPSKVLAFVDDSDAPPAPPPPIPPWFVVAAVATATTKERPYPSSVVVCGVALYRDALFSVLRHLDMTSLLRAARVCRLFSLMAREDSLWKRFAGKTESQFVTSFRALKREGLQFSFSGVERNQWQRKIERMRQRWNDVVFCRRCSQGFFFGGELMCEQLATAGLFEQALICVCKNCAYTSRLARSPSVPPTCDKVLKIGIGLKTSDCHESLFKTMNRVRGLLSIS